MKCRKCKAPAEISLPSHNTAFCRDCFATYFTGQVEKAIRRHKLILPGERVLVALSGGKDSLSLMLELSRLGYDVTGLHVDLGIPVSSPAATSSSVARSTIPATVSLAGSTSTTCATMSAAMASRS